mmetsp:Transcript_26347/g.42675  ORF Transcript_26347/g.42675 Transcript_26347/m.42675 type:complete len:274 (-) Transcript_26347:44-865(-)
MESLPAFVDESAVIKALGEEGIDVHRLTASGLWGSAFSSGMSSWKSQRETLSYSEYVHLAKAGNVQKDSKVNDSGALPVRIDAVCLERVTKKRSKVCAINTKTESGIVSFFNAHSERPTVTMTVKVTEKETDSSQALNAVLEKVRNTFKVDLTEFVSPYAQTRLKTNKHGDLNTVLTEFCNAKKKLELCSQASVDFDFEALAHLVKGFVFYDMNFENCNVYVDFDISGKTLCAYNFKANSLNKFFVKTVSLETRFPVFHTPLQVFGFSRSPHP